MGRRETLVAKQAEPEHSCESGRELRVATLQQCVGELRDAGHDGLDVGLAFQFFEMGVEKFLHHVTELGHGVESRVVDYGDGLGEVVMAPRIVFRRLIDELRLCQLAESIDLVLDRHSKDFGVFDNVILLRSWLRRSSWTWVDRHGRISRHQEFDDRAAVFRCIAGDDVGVFGRLSHALECVGGVVEVIKVMNHEFDDLRVVAETVGVLSIDLSCLQLDGAGSAFLSLVSMTISSRPHTSIHALNPPLLNAASKSLD